MKTLRYMCPNKDTTLTFISSLCKAVLYKNCGDTQHVRLIQKTLVSDFKKILKFKYKKFALL